jgi:hypothetical protein
MGEPRGGVVRPERRQDNVEWLLPKRGIFGVACHRARPLLVLVVGIRQPAIHGVGIGVTNNKFTLCVVTYMYLLFTRQELETDWRIY